MAVTRIMISMHESMLEKVDTVANEEHRTRSELVREAVRSYIAESKREAGS